MANYFAAIFLPAFFILLAVVGFIFVDTFFVIFFLFLQRHIKHTEQYLERYLKYACLLAEVNGACDNFNRFSIAMSNISFGLFQAHIFQELISIFSAGQ